MYHAKKLGRNNVQFYTESMGAVTHERVKLASEPHEALRSGNSSFITSPRSTPRRA
jgi:hypothetical protein